MYDTASSGCGIDGALVVQGSAPRFLDTGPRYRCGSRRKGTRCARGNVARKMVCC